TVFGGPECYPLLSGLKFAEYPYVDIVIYGEAEITIKKVIDSLCKNGKILPFPGTIVNINGNITDCGWGEYITDLDSLPNLGSALEVFPLELYVKKESLPISFNRGCLYSCKYCPRGMYPRLRCRSAENLIKEIRCLRQMYPDKHNFKVCDASLTDNLHQLEQLCDFILSEGLTITLGGFASPNPGLNYRLLSKIRRAGFNSFCYGVETGSERLIHQLSKKIKIETIERVIKETFEAGINVTIDMMVGIANESENDFDESINFLIRNKRYINNVGINECAELPYSYVFSHLDEFEIIPQEIKRDRHKRMKELIDSLYLPEAQKFNFIA
ncbi:MAG: radical SAM protein, partial [Candidatus Omnitrophota bacterium]